MITYTAFCYETHTAFNVNEPIFIEFYPERVVFCRTGLVKAFVTFDCWSSKISFLRVIFNSNKFWYHSHMIINENHVILSYRFMLSNVLCIRIEAVVRMQKIKSPVLRTLHPDFAHILFTAIDLIQKLI